MFMDQIQKQPWKSTELKKKKLFVSKDEISINCQFLVFLAEIGQKIITIKTVLLGNY